MVKIKINQGELQGKLCETYDGKKFYSFEGIPYAKPPVGSLRFQPPQDPDNWSGVRDATKPGNICLQFGNNGIEGSEDCLYLNVYTPVLPIEEIKKLPVIFFVHGGRLIVGYSHYYQPDYLIKHQVVIVTINYRLHILGFLCLENEKVPGNAGLKDSLKALEWVHNNIKYFNGDENNVTAFGESAGAGIVTSYLFTNLADGLVHKIIDQSGVASSHLYMNEEDTIEKAKAVCSALGKELKNIEEVYSFLLAASAEDMLNATLLLETSRHPTVINAYFLPVVEKKFKGIVRFFDEYPQIAIRNGRFKKLPLMLVSNTHEGALFLNKKDAELHFEKDLKHFIPWYAHVQPESKEAYIFAYKLKQFYFKNKNFEDWTKSEYLDFVTDAYFMRDISMFIEYLSKRNKNVYYSKFLYTGSLNTTVMKNLGLTGTSHGDVIQYQFYRKSKAEKATEIDEKIVDFICEGWCNFARNGKPSWSSQNIEWPAYTPKEKHCLLIDAQPKVVKRYQWDRTAFWIGALGEKCKL